MVIKTRFERDQKVWFRRGSNVCEDIGVELEEYKVFATREEAEEALVR